MSNIEDFPPSKPADTQAKAPRTFKLSDARARPEDYGTVTTKKMPDKVEIGRPDKGAYIRVHPEYHEDLNLVPQHRGFDGLIRGSA
jgi:hypothetical protein